MYLRYYCHCRAKLRSASLQEPILALATPMRRRSCCKIYVVLRTLLKQMRHWEARSSQRLLNSLARCSRVLKTLLKSRLVALAATAKRHHEKAALVLRCGCETNDTPVLLLVSTSSLICARVAQSAAVCYCLCLQRDNDSRSSAKLQQRTDSECSKNPGCIKFASSTAMQRLTVMLL
jgi:hypothetical protein